LGKDEGKLSVTMAKHLLTLSFSDRDTERMHELAVRNQVNDLSDREKEELLAFTKAGTLISILKSRARRVISNKAKNGRS